MSNAPIPYHGEQPYSDAPEAYDPNEHNRHASLASGGAGNSPRTVYSDPNRQSSIVSPNSPPPQYPSPDGQYSANNEMQQDNRHSAYKGSFVPEVAAVNGPQSMGDVENQNQTAYAGAGGLAPMSEKKRFKDKRLCGIPMLWFIALIALIVIAGAVGGGVGGALGSKKKDNKPDQSLVVPGDGGIENPETNPIPEEPTGGDEPNGNSTTTDPDAAKPTKKVPTGVVKPRDDSWYYMKNPFGKQNQELGLEVLVLENTPYLAVSEPRGDLWEHWGFWPASRNSTRAKDYRERLNITSELYILYNRGLVQRANSTSPTTETVNDQQGWWWIEENPNGGVYIKGGLYGPDYAYTVLEVGEKTDEDIYRFEANWNRTEETGGRGRFVDGQIWQIELAFAFLEGEKGIWDNPAEAATATASSAIAIET